MEDLAVNPDENVVVGEDEGLEFDAEESTKDFNDTKNVDSMERCQVISPHDVKAESYNEDNSLENQIPQKFVPIVSGTIVLEDSEPDIIRLNQSATPIAKKETHSKCCNII